MATSRATLAALAAALVVAAVPAQAGRGCTDKPLTAAALSQGMALAQRTRDALDASGAQAAVLARAGQDLTRYGLAWSHLGLAYREPGSGRWRVVHKLNHCGTATADVYRQGLGEFFLDDPWRYEAAFVPLADAPARAVARALGDDAAAARLHSRAYSMTAYPWSTRYQQSNQFAIETLAALVDPQASTRARAQAWLQLHDYRPTTLRLGSLERLGARVGTANIAFDDHPPERRISGRIDTVTADSVFAWLARSGLGGALQVVR